MSYQNRVRIAAFQEGTPTVGVHEYEGDEHGAKGFCVVDIDLGAANLNLHLDDPETALLIGESMATEARKLIVARIAAEARERIEASAPVPAQ